MADIMPFGIVDDHHFPDELDLVKHEMPYVPWDGRYFRRPEDEPFDF